MFFVVPKFNHCHVILTFDCLKCVCCTVSLILLLNSLMFRCEYVPFIHYANMSVQYTAIFHGYKNDYFQMKNCNIFLYFAQNVDCGHSLGPPH